LDLVDRSGNAMCHVYPQAHSKWSVVIEPSSLPSTVRMHLLQFVAMAMVPFIAKTSRVLPYDSVVDCASFNAVRLYSVDSALMVSFPTGPAKAVPPSPEDIRNNTTAFERRSL
jgi:hypothetical protein